MKKIWLLLLGLVGGQCHGQALVWEAWSDDQALRKASLEWLTEGTRLWVVAKPDLGEGWMGGQGSGWAVGPLGLEGFLKGAKSWDGVGALSGLWDDSTRVYVDPSGDPKSRFGLALGPSWLRARMQREKTFWLSGLGTDLRKGPLRVRGEVRYGFADPSADDGTVAPGFCSLGSATIVTGTRKTDLWLGASDGPLRPFQGLAAFRFSGVGEGIQTAVAGGVLSPRFFWGSADTSDRNLWMEAGWSAENPWYSGSMNLGWEERLDLGADSSQMYGSAEAWVETPLGLLSAGGQGRFLPGGLGWGRAQAQAEWHQSWRPWSLGCRALGRWVRSGGPRWESRAEADWNSGSLWATWTTTVAWETELLSSAEWELGWKGGDLEALLTWERLERPWNQKGWWILHGPDTRIRIQIKGFLGAS